MTVLETAIGAVARASGAIMVEVEGGVVAAHFGEPAAEYRVLRDGAAIVDLGLDGSLCVSGADRHDFLQGMLSNDIKARAVGQGCRTFLLSDQGKVVADLLALVNDDTVVLSGAASGVAAALPALDRCLVADEVELTPIGSSETVVGLFGPGASAALAALGVSTPPTGHYDHGVVDVEGTSVRVVCVPAPGVGGYLCMLPADAVVAWWSRVAAAGLATPVGHEAYELMRIESGMPRYGRDVTSDTLALETPFEGAISFNKGCYLGQEIVERVMARGHVNRRLVGLVLAGDEPPRPGERVAREEREVGWLTSVAWSWERGCFLALGYVRREHMEPGTDLEIDAASGAVAATVAALPFR